MPLKRCWKKIIFILQISLSYTSRTGNCRKQEKWSIYLFSPSRSVLITHGLPSPSSFNCTHLLTTPASPLYAHSPDAAPQPKTSTVPWPSQLLFDRLSSPSSSFFPPNSITCVCQSLLGHISSTIIVKYVF